MQAIAQDSCESPTTAAAESPCVGLMLVRHLGSGLHQFWVIQLFFNV